MIELRMPEWVRTVLIILFAAIIFFFCATGCKSVAPVASTDTVERIVIKERLKDTTIFITDSAGFRAALECDSLGQVRIKQIQDYYAGQWVKPSVVVKNNYLKVDCKIDSMAVYVAMKLQDTTKVTSINTVKVDRVNYLKPHQWVFVYLGYAFLCLILIYVVYRLLRRYTGIKL